MPELTRDSISTNAGITQDSSSLKQSIFIESRSSSDQQIQQNLYSKDLLREGLPDWYFILILIFVALLALVRSIYGKFLNSVFISALSYQSASKVYKEQSIFQRRFNFGLDIFYLLNATAFLLFLNRHFSPGIVGVTDTHLVFGVFLIFSGLIFFRIVVMRLIGFIFKKSELFKGFLYHYFIFNKLTGLVLFPFLIAIPFTQGLPQEIIIYTSISIVFVIQVFRLVRMIIFVIKNVVLFFYLILYLCILEILPLLVVIKLLLSLAKV